MDGVIIIDKEKDYTSRDVVNLVGKYLHTKKVGHTGTLDPLATGVLVIAVNKGLKVINLINNDDKEYIASVKVGILTDTLDIEGKVLKTSDRVIDRDKLVEVLNSFKGKYLQEVPKYSAVKVNGKRLYEYARNNIDVELPNREVDIKKIELLEYSENKFTIRCLVSKGTYIRSLIRDIGERAGIYLTMDGLRRTKQGIFTIEDSYKLSNVEKGEYKLLPLVEVLTNYKQIEVDNELLEKIKNGIILDNTYGENIVIFTKDKEVIAIYKRYDKDITKIKPVHVLV